MAFPGTYNFNYYKGDTLEFRVYPKDSTGGTFPLSQFVSPNGLTKFTIATSRGATTGIIEGYAQISNDQSHILCAITPANGAEMTAGTQYVYDIEISRASALYDYVFTLLTGTISVTDQVTQPQSLELPNNPTDLTLDGITTNSISISWTAPVAGGEVENYKLYILPYTTDPIVIFGALSGTPTATVGSETTSYTFAGLSSSTGYLVGVRSSNTLGDASIETVLSNLLAGPITTLAEVS
jgi:hypothetical protein